MAVINGSIFDDVLQGTLANDQLNGFSGNDFLSGGGGNDSLFGDAGNDYMLGTVGFSVMNGGSGVDFVDYSFLNAAISLEATGIINKGAAGVDQIFGVEAIIGAPGFANTINGFTGQSSQVSLTVNLTDKVLIVNNIPGLGTQGFTVENFVNVFGTSQADSIVGNAFSNFFDGGAGNDVILGEGGNDIIFGSFGNDFLDGGTGDDSVFGEFGDDVLLGFTGSDILSGGAGTDTLLGEAGNDFLIGYGGTADEFDLLVGGTGADAFFLGDTVGANYLGSGFATVLDFNRFEGDSIVLGGNPGSYSFGAQNFFGTSTLDTLIFSNGDLVGIVQDTPTLGAGDLIYI